MVLFIVLYKVAVLTIELVHQLMTSHVFSGYYSNETYRAAFLRWYTIFHFFTPGMMIENFLVLFERSPGRLGSERSKHIKASFTFFQAM